MDHEQLENQALDECPGLFLLLLKILASERNGGGAASFGLALGTPQMPNTGSATGPQTGG